MWNANTTLMGQSAIPLREYSLQRHPTKWAVHSTTSGEKVSDVRLTYSVSTTPGPIENLVMTDVKECGVVACTAHIFFLSCANIVLATPLSMSAALFVHGDRSVADLDKL